MHPDRLMQNKLGGLNLPVSLATGTVLAIFFGVMMLLGFTPTTSPPTVPSS